MGDIGRDLIEGLQDFADKLRRGVPIEATRVERFDTPDGPMHVHTPVVLFEEEQSDG
jgi:hypothetical protein